MERRAKQKATRVVIEGPKGRGWFDNNTRGSLTAETLAIWEGVKAAQGRGKGEY